MVALLFKAGDHEPVILLVDVVGSGFKFPPGQIGATALNVGITLESTFKVTVLVLVALQEFVAVNVNVMVPLAEGLRV